MDIRIYGDESRLNGDAADIVGEALRGGPASAIGLCTGMTPVGLYRELVRRRAKGEISFADATVCNLDEYIGLTPDDPNGFRAFMRKRLLDEVDLPPERFFIPDGSAPDPEDECRRFDAVLDGIGRRRLQVVGIGGNGHVGFNEPDDSLPYGTRVVRLSDRTVQTNAAYFDPPDRIPRRAITMGIGSILDADRLLLIALGKEKAEAVAGALAGPITARLPGSLLRLHPRLTVLLDREAASLLPERLKADAGLARAIRPRIEDGFDETSRQ